MGGPGKKHNIPTSIDIAADVPPVSNLWKFNDMGFDFVVISGGKAIRGPTECRSVDGQKRYHCRGTAAYAPTRL